MTSELEKRLNLLTSSPAFALQERDDGSADVIRPASIPPDGCTYWIHAKVTLANGKILNGVFIISQGGANQDAIFLQVGRRWIRSDAPELASALALTKEDIFPLDWIYSIKAENDIYKK